MSGIQMALLGTGAGISVLDTQTVTTGAVGTAGELDRMRGYSSGAFGSIVDGTSNIYGGAQVGNLYWDEGGGVGFQSYVLSIAGATNSGWTTLTIGTKTLNRVDATFAFFSSVGNWNWPTADLAANQAFGALGAIKVCTFT